MDNKTNQARDATEALGLQVDWTKPWTEDIWVNAVTRCFERERSEAKESLREQRSMDTRLHMASASALANLLAMHYQARENTELADQWFLRSRRYHSRAFRRNGVVLASLDTEMP